MFLETLQTEDGIDALDTETVAFRKRPNRVSFWVGHVLCEDQITKLIRNWCWRFKTRVQWKWLSKRVSEGVSCEEMWDELNYFVPEPVAWSMSLFKALSNGF